MNGYLSLKKPSDILLSNSSDTRDLMQNVLM